MTSLRDTPGPYARLWRRAAERAQPLAANLELTHDCNWRCAFCYLPPAARESELSTAEWIGVLDELRALGTLTVSFTGGEPLAHPGFLEIVRAARQRHLAWRLLTNGSLITETLADALAEMQPLGVELSLHGASASIHDELVGCPGAFDATLAGAQRLRKRGVRLLLKTVLTRRNERELDDLVRLAARLGIDHQIDPAIIPRDDGSQTPLTFRASAGAIERAYRGVARQGPLPSARRQADGLACAIARTTLAIDPEGNVYPCLRWRWDSLGNVRQQSLRTLWPGSPLRTRIADLARLANARLMELGEPCLSFPYCLGSARAETGDPLVPAAFHVLLADTVRRLRAEGG